MVTITAGVSSTAGYVISSGGFSGGQPANALFTEPDFGPAQTTASIVPSNVVGGGSQSGNAVIAVDMVNIDTTADGVIFELGDSTAGLAFGHDDGTQTFRVVAYCGSGYGDPGQLVVEFDSTPYQGLSGTWYILVDDTAKTLSVYWNQGSTGIVNATDLVGSDTDAGTSCAMWGSGDWGFGQVNGSVADMGFPGNTAAFTEPGTVSEVRVWDNDPGIPVEVVILSGITRVTSDWPEYAPAAFFAPPSEFNGTDNVTFYNDATLNGPGNRFDTSYSVSVGNIVNGTNPPGFPGPLTQPLSVANVQTTTAIVELGVQLPSGDLQTFFSGPDSFPPDYSPDWIDFHIEFENLNGEQILTSVVSEDISSTAGPGTHLTVQFLEDAPGSWRVRFTGLQNMDLASGDGNSFTFSQFDTNGPFGGWRWAVAVVRFSVDGDPHDFTLGMNWNFFSS